VAQVAVFVKRAMVVEESARLLDRQIVSIRPCMPIESTIDEDEPSIVAEDGVPEGTWAKLLHSRGQQSNVSRDGSCATTPSSTRGCCATRRSSRSGVHGRPVAGSSHSPTRGQRSSRSSVQPMTGSSHSPMRGQRPSSQSAGGSPRQSAGRCRRVFRMSRPSSADTTMASTPRSGGSSVAGAPHVPSRCSSRSRKNSMSPSRSRKNSMSRTCTLVPESQMKPPPTPGLFKTDPVSQSRRNSISRRAAPSPKSRDGNVDSPPCSPHLPSRRTYIQPARSSIFPTAAAAAASTTVGEAHQSSIAAATQAPGLKAVDLIPEARTINIERARSIRPVMLGCSGTAAACPTTDALQWHLAAEICPAKPMVMPVRPVVQRVQEPWNPCFSPEQQVAGTQGCRHNELPKQRAAVAAAAAAPSVSCRQCKRVPPNLGLRASTTMRSNSAAGGQLITTAGVGLQMPVTPPGAGMQRPLTPHVRRT